MDWRAYESTALICLVPCIARLADALAVERDGEAEQFPAREIGQQKGMASRFEEPCDIAGKQRAALIGRQVKRRDRACGVALERRTKREVAQGIAAELVDGVDAHG